MFDKYVQECTTHVKKLLRNAMGGGLVGPRGDLRVWLSLKGPHNLILAASCTEFQGEQLWFSLNRLTFFGFWSFLTHISKNVQKCTTNVNKNFSEMLWEVVWWVHMEIHGSEWVRMVPRDSQGASWGFLGPQGVQKGGFWVFGGGGARGGLPSGLPISPIVG